MYNTLLAKLCFRQGDASPSVFRHHGRHTTTSVHGGGFTISGPADALDWLEAVLAERYGLTISPHIGPGPRGANAGRVSNRATRWLGGRIGCECGPRQVACLLAGCGPDGAQAVATPGIKATSNELGEDGEELPGHLSAAFRGAAARGNYLASDRLDA